MANSFYNTIVVDLAAGGINLSTHTLKATLIDAADYTFSAAHDRYDDVAAAAKVAVSTPSGVTTTSGTLDTDDVVFSSVTGDQCEAVILWVDRGTGDASSPLLAYYDTMTGLPVTPDGSNITLVVNASGWISI